MIAQNKKGVEITLQTIIIAVLVIIVLIVLILIFTKGTGGFIIGISSCEDRGGQCGGDAETCTTSGGSVYRFGKCSSGEVCCIPEQSIIKDENEPGY